MRGGTTALAFVMALLASAGCTEIECSGGPQPAVELIIEEPGGPFTEEIVIRYRIDGGAWVIAGVEDDSRCLQRNRCSIAYELSGVLEFEVLRGGRGANVVTTVTATRCRVATQTITVTIPEP